MHGKAHAWAWALPAGRVVGKTSSSSHLLKPEHCSRYPLPHSYAPSTASRTALFPLTSTTGECFSRVALRAFLAFLCRASASSQPAQLLHNLPVPARTLPCAGPADANIDQPVSTRCLCSSVGRWSRSRSFSKRLLHFTRASICGFPHKLSLCTTTLPRPPSLQARFPGQPITVPCGPHAAGLIGAVHLDVREYPPAFVPTVQTTSFPVCTNTPPSLSPGEAPS